MTMPSSHNIQCGFFDVAEDGTDTPCLHRADVVANVPWLGIRIPACSHCAHGYELEISGHPIPHTPSPGDLDDHDPTHPAPEPATPVHPEPEPAPPQPEPGPPDPEPGP